MSLFKPSSVSLSRRHLLKSLALAMGGEVLSKVAPSLNPFGSSSLYAQTPSGSQKRLLLFFTPNGNVPHRFYPTGSESQFNIASDSVLAPLEEIKNDLIILEGLNFLTGNNHEGGMAAMLTNGTHADSITHGASLDQYLVQSLQPSTPIPSLELGVMTDPWGASIQTRMNYQQAGQYVHPDSDPRSVFRRLFGSSENDQEQVIKDRLARQSVIDFVLTDLNQLRSKVGGLPRQKLDQHLQSVREVEMRLQALDGIQCDTPLSPPRLSHLDAQVCPQLLESQMDLALLALSCNLTSIASIQFSHTVSPLVFSWIGQNETHHSLSHSGNGTAGLDHFIEAEQWCAEQFKTLVNRLKSTPDSINGGTLFDHTITVWVKEMGDSRLHICDSVPFIIAGTGGGSWQTGRFLQCGGQSHSHLLVSICQAMGLQNQTFGDPTTGTGPLSILA